MRYKVLSPIDVTTKNDLGQVVVTTHLPGEVVDLEEEKGAILIASEAVEPVKEARSKKDKAGEGE